MCYRKGGILHKRNLGLHTFGITLYEKIHNAYYYSSPGDTQFIKCKIKFLKKIKKMQIITMVKHNHLTDEFKDDEQKDRHQ